MTKLKELLAEKNISVREFSKITKIKEKKVKRVLDNQAFFNGDEATRVSAFLGVSKNELYHGVVERKGELPEVAEQNNINHFRFYLKKRVKTSKNLLNFLAFMGGVFFAFVAIAYIALMFSGITGLPTVLRSVDVMLLCFIIPFFGSFLFVDIAKEKVLEKGATVHSKINIEAAGVSIMLLVYSIYAFVNDFIPVQCLVFTIIGAISLVAISILSPFKNKPFNNRILQFVVYMIPTLLLIASEIFGFKYVKAITPAEEGAAGEALATAADLFNMVFLMLIFCVFCFSLIQFFNVFVKGVGRFFEPVKKTKSIRNIKLATSIVLCIALSVATFLCIWVSQGVYLKYVYATVLEGKEDSVNWTADFITDFESQYKKGEYDVVKFEGMKIKIPKAYSFDKKTEYTTIYKKGEDNFIMLQKPMYEQPLDFELFDEDFGDGKYTEEQKEEMKEDFIKYFGFYPQNMYEWHKLQGSVTLDDVDIFNPRKTAMLITPLMMKSIAGIPDSEYYLYENGDMYATIIIHTVKNEEKGDREMVSVSFGSPNLEYSFTLAHPDQDNDKTIEEVTKILNSVKMN